MQLHTLGGLRVEGAEFTRVKPLLVLAFLAVEGPGERRHLAELFWPEASDPLNSLSAALSRLRRGLAGCIEADESRVWTTLSCDALTFVEALKLGRFQQANRLYQGTFLDGVFLSDWSAELEEWMYARREDLAARMQRMMLEQAELTAARGDFAESGRQAEASYTLASAPAAEPELLIRYFTLLQAGESPLSARVREEAGEYDMALTLTPDEAKSRLKRLFLGREEELKRLGAVASGQWAWIRGSAGMGKTSLLKSLSGIYLPARAGLPYASLEPLLGKRLLNDEYVLQAITQHRGPLLIDDWEKMDAESRRVLERVQTLGSRASIIVSSCLSAPFPVNMLIELTPLPKQALARYPGAWETTGGLPVFVEAFLRGLPLGSVLEDRLAGLSGPATDVFLALALLPEPDLTLVRRALELDAATMASVLEDLLNLALISAEGEVQVSQAAEDYLQKHPTRSAPLALKLARNLPSLEAFRLYEHSRVLWSVEDEPGAASAYLAQARELINRGFPQEAASCLKHAPPLPGVKLLLARAWERVGKLKEADEILRTLASTESVLAIHSAVLRRLGRSREAEEAARDALEGDIPTRAEALNTLGMLALESGDFTHAIKHFRRSATLWLAAGNDNRWAGSLNNIGIATAEMGEDAEAAFRDALEAAGDNLTLSLRILGNLGKILRRKEKYLEAEQIYLDVTLRAEQSGNLSTMALAWNSLGALYHRLGKVEQATRAYHKALEFARRTGEQGLIAGPLANMAELTEDEDAWSEAMRMFEEAGMHNHARSYRDNLTPGHPFRAQSESER